MKKAFLLVFSFIVSISAYSQTAALYSFQAFSSPYVSVAPTGTNVAIVCDDCRQRNIPVPFNFVFCGISYNNISMCSNGWVSLDNNGGTGFTPGAANVNSPGWLMPYWADHQGSAPGCGTTSFAYYATSGVAPNRVFTLEWRDYNAYNWGAPTCACCLANFQIKLYETSGVIDFCYGSSNSSGLIAGTIGIANSTTDWQTLNNVSASPTPSSTVFRTNLSTLPANNQVYRWTPCPLSLTPTNNSPVCAGGTLNLFGTAAGGATGFSWTGPAGYTSGIQNPSITPVTAAHAGTYTFTATQGTCSVSAMTTVTVNVAPPANTGATSVCVGSTITLNNTATTPGTWASSATGIANVNTTTGVVTGVAPGTAVISYVNVCGAATTTVTVYPVPGPISGPTLSCVGTPVTLSNSLSPGTWSSSNVAIAAINVTTGVVNPIAGGSANITYTTAGGCRSVTSFNVAAGPNPFTITPNAAVFCSGSQMLTAPPIPGAVVDGIWSSGAPFNVPDNTPSGVANTITVSGIPAGATINSTAAILNNVSMAQDGQLGFNLQSPIGNTISLVNRQGGTGANFINTEISTAAVLPFAIGAAPFSNLYMPDGVSVGAATLGTGATGYPANVTNWAPLTVIPSGNWVLAVRDYVAGTTAVVNQWSMKMNYTTQPGGYVWTPAAGLYLDAALSVPYIAGSMSNTVFASPSATTVYTATGTIVGLPCTATSTATITIAGGLGAGLVGNTSVCQGSTTQLSSPLSGGVWSSTNSGVATVSATGVVSGVAVGTSVISYYNGCLTSATVTVNAALPAITGNTTICPGTTTILANTIAGTWTSSSAAIATTSAGLSTTTTVTGGAVPGTALITVTAPTGCQATTSVTVKEVPGIISGPSSMCVGVSAPLSNAIAGGTWSSSNSSIATVTLNGGVVTSVAPGTVVITYSNGCTAVTLSILVKGVPTGITGLTNVCTGTSVTLSNAIPNGTWSSVAPAVATVDSFTGIVTGGTSAGPVTIIYSTGCGTDATIIVNNNVTPSIISGTTTICYGGTSTLSNNGLPAGTWTSSNPAVATVVPGSGLVTAAGAVAGGVTTITATNSCGSTSVTYSVSPLPVLSGVTTFCQNGSTTLSSTLGSGTWSSSNLSVATTNTVGNPGIINGTGIGFTPGPSVITQVNAIGCAAVLTITTTPTPTAISGIFGVCVGSVTNLTDITPGGVWSSTAPGIAAVSSTGNVTGNSAGMATISYIIGTCGASATVTVDALPGAIQGPAVVCVGNSIQLSNISSPGFWTSSNPGSAAVDANGLVTGIAIPGANITYSTPAGCITSRSITVSPSPGSAGITGNTTLCAGQSSQLSNTTGTGTWSSSNPLAGVIGVNTGFFVTNTASVGATTISYTTPAGCYTTTVVTVNAMPSPITGSSAMCTGTNATLGATPSTGVWSSSAPIIASIDPTSGVITAGILPGSAVIVYSLPTGCSTSLTVTVNQLPPAITGNTDVCLGLTTTLSNSLAGGTWTSVSPGTAPVSATGVVTGNGIGTSVISYTRAGCAATTTVTVNPLPLAITGPTSVCVGASISLTNANGGGTWTSSNNLLAAVGASSGIVTGVGAGTPTITYTLSTGCSRTIAITVSPNPLPIAGSNIMCATSTATLSSGIAAGTWSSSNPTVATVAPVAATTTLITAGANPGGTAVITFSLTPTGCATTFTVTVNPIPAPIMGATVICIGSTTQLTNLTAGGVWSSSAPGIAAINSTGLVNGIAAGTSRISYVNPISGCFATTSVTVNGLPTAIGGIPTVCVNGTTQLSNGTSGGLWTVSNANASVSPSGLVTGNAAGTATVTYTLGSGCIQTINVTINPLPSAILGTFVICKDAVTTLSNATPGGTWSSSNAGFVSITSPGGVATGVNAGSARITYTLSTTGCTAVQTMTVNPLPSVIAGLNTVCEGSTINISNSVGGGVWSSSDPLLATVGVTGTSVLVGGVSAGVADITYTLGTGCFAVKSVTVTVQPGAIIGTPVQICQGSTLMLSNATAGGTWTSSNVSIATVDAATGAVYASAVTTGPANISYTIGSCRSVGIVTVKPQPGAIVGNKTICQGSSTILSSTVGLGAWSSDNLSIATVNAANGTVFASTVNTGTSNITYTLNGCSAMTTVTVTPQPGPIAGPGNVCNTNCITLSNAVAGGVWSTNSTAIATVNPATGVVCGIGVGNATITYTLGSCFVLKVVAVNTQPTAITGPTQVCNGSTIQLSNAAGTGVWTSSNASVATVTNTGLVTGLTVGSTVITMQIGVCYATTTITVNPPPSAITGTFYLCQNSTTTLGNLTPGGTWSSSNNIIATVGFNTGIVYGVTTGPARISYTLISTGCVTSQTISVIAAPAPIQGSASVCLGGTTQLSNVTSGGTWSSSNNSVATIDLAGVAGGVSAGTVVVSYTLGTGCRVIAPLVVYPMTPTTGAASVCAGLSISLSNATVGGAWSSNDVSIATVHPTNGLVTGVSGGNAVIAYTLPSGCVSAVTLAVLPAPSPIIGLSSVCVGQTISLTDTTAGGAWSTSDIAKADVDAFGVVTGNAVGTVNISYTAGGCPAIKTITVNGAASPITGNLTICLGNTSDLNDATPGGTWFTSDTTVATIDTAGIVTAVGVGTTIIIYAPPTGCVATAMVTVNSLPSIITGPSAVCVGSTIALTDSIAGGAWTSSNYSVASVGFSSGLVTGLMPGTATITYQIFNGCTISTVISVDALPVISGPAQVCVGNSVTLSASPAGGAWSSGTTPALNVNASTGVVTGLTAGTANVTYTSGATGCNAVITMSVNPLPAPITGNFKVCKGGTSQLANASAGGVWSSSNSFVGTVNPTTGLVYSDLNPFTSVFDVMYTLPTGCAAVQTMTVVNAPSPISGLGQVCVGSCIPLSDTTAGGVWSSFDPTVATVDPVTGQVCGASAGFTIITYTMGGGACYQTHVVTVNPLPAPITGITQVCYGLTTQLSDATPGGTWGSQNPGIAAVTVNGGLVTGTAVGGGVTNITYTLAATGCFTTTTLITHPLPAPITGNTNICLGSVRVLSSSPGPGVWTVTNTSIATITPTTGIITGVDFNVPPGSPYGMTTVTYTNIATTCIRTTTVAVHPLPQIYTVTGGGSYCSGTGGVHIGLSGSQIGVSYYLYLGTATPTGPIAGTGGPLDFGLQTSGGVYTVVANNTYTTCSSNMTGSAIITVIPSVTPTVNILPTPNDTVCAGTSVTFIPVATDPGASPVYNWSVNGVGVSVAASYTFVPADGDRVTVVLNSNAICAIPGTASDTLTMAVYPSAPPAVSIAFSPNDTVCTGSAVTFTAVPYNGGPSPAYQWYVNYVAVSTAPSYTYMPVSGDMVFVNMVSNSPCRIGDSAISNVETVTIVAPVIPVVTITGSAGSIIAAGTSDTLTANVTGAVSPTFQWYVDGIPIAGATSSTFVIDNANFGDSVGCLVVSGGICREQAFGWMYLQVHAVGVSQVNGQNSDLIVTPNPAKGAFFIKGTLGSAAGEEVSLELTNMLGQTVYKGDVKARNSRLDERIQLSSNVANGMYMLSVRTGTEHKIFHIVIEQ